MKFFEKLYMFYISGSMKKAIKEIREDPKIVKLRYQMELDEKNMLDSIHSDEKLQKDLVKFMSNMYSELLNGKEPLKKSTMWRNKTKKLA